MFFGRVKRLGYQFMDLVAERPNLKPGAVVWCDLGIGWAEHSGIYVGNGKIVELSGDGIIREVTKSQFLDGDGSGIRTGINIYAICKGNSVLSSTIIADRAKRMIGNTRNYHVFFDNCHQFTAGCITGDFDNPSNAFEMLKWDIQSYYDELFITSKVVYGP